MAEARTPRFRGEAAEQPAEQPRFRKVPLRFPFRFSFNFPFKFPFEFPFKFPFELISDPQEKLCKLFDVIKEKSMYGKKYMGIERSTFLIDSNNKLIKEWRKVKVPGHAQEVLETLEEHLKS